MNYRYLLWLLLFSGFVLFIFLKAIDIGLKKYTRHNNIIYVPSLVGLDLDLTKDTLYRMGLNFKIIDSAAYNPAYDRGDVLSHQPKHGSEVKEGRQIYLTINPLTIHYIPLPDLQDKSLRQAMSLLENNAFILGDLQYVDHYAQNLVRYVKVNSQIVNHNDSLPKFTKVDLYLGDGYNEHVLVPDLVGINFTQIKQKLNNNSLNLGPFYMDSSIVDTALSVAYKQDPIANEKVPLGSYISVWFNESLK